MSVIGEDATSIDRHVKVLQDQYRRTQPDVDVVEQLMIRTFAWRRKEIADGMTVMDAVNKYPFLRNPYGVVKSLFYIEINFVVNIFPFKFLLLCIKFRAAHYWGRGDIAILLIYIN